MRRRSQASSSSVECGDTSAPSARAPCLATMSVRPCATNSSAVCQSTTFQSPPCFTIGAVRRSSELSALVGEAVLVGSQHSLMASFSSGSTRITRFAFHLHTRLLPSAIVRRHGLAARQLPRAGGIAERLGRQRTDRAHVDRVAGQLGVDGLADERDDLRVLAAADHAEFHHAGDLLAEADTARALDAAGHLLGGNQRTQILMEHDALRFL